MNESDIPNDFGDLLPEPDPIDDQFPRKEHDHPLPAEEDECEPNTCKVREGHCIVCGAEAASVEAAMIAAEYRTPFPAFTKLLPNASPTTPTGHAVQTWRKKNVIGGHVRPRGLGITLTTRVWLVRSKPISLSTEWPTRHSGWSTCRH
jgi:hypothetical protein